MNDTPTFRKNSLARSALWALAVIALGLLAAFVVRNIFDFIPVGRCRHAKEVIRKIHLACQRMRTDAELPDLRGFLNPNGVRKALAIEDSVDWGWERIGKAQELYTSLYTLLLRDGRNALETQATIPAANGVPVERLLNPEFVNRLGTTYHEVGLDPWGNPFEIWPGPCQLDSMPFRIFRNEDPKDESTFTPDSYTKDWTDEATGITSPAAFPAPPDLRVYVFSRGKNGRSDQLHGTGEGIGLDDINNWDYDRTWWPFYHQGR